ncbi:hypothetical protein FOZ63_013445 [Perkinsus olseni]|uniref:Uncharacterized protein n=1 Tax=Perkinsus olseni TaxID=32597 RepID=A0A7J6NIV6_PEROL|nr:hypothetical protein FOZ60_009132 [Perkinsus olseni]KAF4741145.1 hypothetical protein FOZ62_013705 [Perkinsus olseni]KAF4745364.1 hypothetical protein FOZ63_013445 [Perkinsus olseni]
MLTCFVVFLVVFGQLTHSYPQSYYIRESAFDEFSIQVCQDDPLNNTRVYLHAYCRDDPTQDPLVSAALYFTQTFIPPDDHSYAMQARSKEDHSFFLQRANKSCHKTNFTKEDFTFFQRFEGDGAQLWAGIDDFFADFRVRPNDTIMYYRRITTMGDWLSIEVFWEDPANSTRVRLHAQCYDTPSRSWNKAVSSVLYYNETSPNLYELYADYDSRKAHDDYVYKLKQACRLTPLQFSGDDMTALQYFDDKRVVLGTTVEQNHNIHFSLPLYPCDPS